MKEIITESNQNDEPYQELYYVVKNIEEQYSLWPNSKSPPLGWEIVSNAKIEQECLQYIEEIWLDMRPLSLRQKFE